MKLRLARLVLVILVFVIFVPVLLAPVSPSSAAQTRPGKRVIVVKSADNLAGVVARAPDSSTVVVVGEHWLTPRPYVDSTCGNCENPNTLVNATVGLAVSGRAKRIVGVSPDVSVIHTGAGYGVLFDRCTGCAIESLSVTGGARDTDGNATDAAIVVKQSSVVIQHNHIFDNIGDSSAVRKVTVGVMGITGREGSDMRIVGNDVVRNSWDGIALYRDARAHILDNVIDGVDLARGEVVGGGRGVGIGLTWNARAEVRRNLVCRYWKGIGVFVDALATVTDNVVEDVATWGISLWDADKGSAKAEIRRNVVFRSGACGAAIISGAPMVSEGGAGDSGVAGGPSELREGRAVQEAGPGHVGPGHVAIRVRVQGQDEQSRDEWWAAFADATRASFSGNALIMTGQNPKYDSGEPYCFQQALALHKKPAGFEESGNILYMNREPGDKPGARDVASASFLDAMAGPEKVLRLSPATARSEFLKWLEAERHK